MTDSKDWKGRGKTLKHPAQFRLSNDFYFGGVRFPAGCEVRQWEGKDFGYTYMIDKGVAICDTSPIRRRLARE